MNSGKLSKTILSLLVVALLAPGLLMAATGKIRGTVVDAETKAPLFGANIVIANTSMGAASDVNGNYIILNVPAGRYSVVIQYMGYKKLTVENIIVAEGITTFHDFELEQSVLEGQEVVIIAKRPLIEKGETNEVHRLSSEDLENMPIRGVNAAVSSMAGVVQDGGNLHVRGGRSDEMAFYVDGVNVTRPMGGNNNTMSVIQNAIEMVQTQTGGFNAEFGGKMSGVTQTTIKTGGPKYKITGEVISDDFWAIKDDRGAYEILGLNEVYSFGYNDYILTVGGPLIPGNDKIRFFVAGQSYNRASNASWYEGFQQDSLQLIKTWYDRDVNAVTDTLDFFVDSAPGRIPGKRNVGWIVNSNLVFDLKPLRIRTGFNYAYAKDRTSNTYPGAFDDVTGGRQPYVDEWNTITAYMNLTHTLDPTSFYTFTASYWNRLYEGYDGKWGDDLMKWGNPELNPALLDASLTRSYPLPFDDQFTVNYPGTPWNTYQKNDETRLQFKFDFTKQWGKAHEIKLGAEYQQETIRRYSIGARALYNRMFDVTDPATGEMREEYTEYDTYAALFPRMVGYDWLGNEVDKDMIVGTKQGVAEETMINIRNKPMKPVHVSAYLQDQIELKDLIINVGARLDHIRNGWWSIVDMTNLTEAPGGVLSDEDIGDEKTFTYISPRIGFSFPVTDQSVFHAQFGKYVQAADPTEIWGMRGYTVYLNRIFKAGYFSPSPNPNLEPEQTTNYEFGFQMQFGPNASLDMTAFYKDTRDLLTRRSIIPQTTAYRAPTMTVNGDFGTVKGFTATFNMRRTSRIQSQLMYTYSIAQGTGSNVGSHNDIAWSEENPRFPKVIQALDFDIRHTATAVIDVRTQAEDGPELMGTYPLGNIGLNLMFNVNSGAPYTRIAIDDAYSEVYGFNTPQPLGAPNTSRLPWLYQLDARLNKSFTVGPVKMTAYLWALNLLNTKSFTQAFRQTGRPDSDGWLLTAEGQKKMADKGEDWLNWYQSVLTNNGTWGWQAPRQIRFGFRFAI